MNVRKSFCVSLLLVLLLGVWNLPPREVSAAPSAPLTPTVGYAVQMDLSPALRDMSPLPAMPQPSSAPAVNFPLPKALRSSAAGGTDPALQSEAGITAMPAPLTSFDGVSNVNGVHPPDTQGDIGYDPATGTKYYVQWVNLSFAVWDGTSPARPPRFTARSTATRSGRASAAPVRPRTMAIRSPFSIRLPIAG